ncbi:ATP-binding protein [Desulfotalea psychrophila]|uniref:Schlafen AlbA-2 domain-containing protein n=1 Tax=Desulfotalea psychrophila (strain LSv54 / DSM 12343) TaxID=177439 RepID=Q6AI81_DESPS|nr:ATP-binding protein [Desulfotalea psychrophila]CAG37848.1 hypothetical protein DPPA01 [Desulfotalea psychrophila LSv54]
MNLQELKVNVTDIISDLKNNGNFPKENSHIDYKVDLKLTKSKSSLENFLLNFAKDIISFSNADGGMILLGIKEDKTTGKNDDVGLPSETLEILEQIDLNDVTQKFEKIAKVGVSIDLQKFKISTRLFYYLIIEKNNQILIPQADVPEYKLQKGAIYYRASSKNEHANQSTADFNRFLQIKANERSKEFMEIWSKLLPEMVDINPREVLILNPVQNRVYGFNSRDNILSNSDVEIDKNQNGVFNIILNAISAGEIGKITTNEGKPIYKIVGELSNFKEHITMTSLNKAVKDKVIYNFGNQHLKIAMRYLGWVDDPKFKVNNPPEGTVDNKFEHYIWVESLDNYSKTTKVFFSVGAADEMARVINNESIHKEIFNKLLIKK